MGMTTFQIAMQLKARLQSVAPRDTGNLADNGIIPKQFGPKSAGVVLGGHEIAPYVVYLENGFTHYRTGKRIDKHKGWVARTVNQFAKEIAPKIGGHIA